jgi:hypothetical protein
MGSVLHWLTALLGAAIIFIGGRFLLSPLTAATSFGVSADGTPTYAYLWAKGVRDIVSGLLLLALLGMRAGDRVLAMFILVAALIPLADLAIVYLNRGTRNMAALMIHGGTAVFMVVLAGLLWRGSG